MHRKKLPSLLFTTLLLIVLLMAGCGPSTPAVGPTTSTEEGPGPTVQPDEEKVVLVYAAYGGLDMIAEEFEKDTGIKFEYVSMSSGEVLSRLQAEKNNPQTDVWFGGGSDAFIQAKDAGLLEAYVSPNAENIQATFRDADGYWTGVSLVSVGFIVNTQRLQEKGLVEPTRWDDLVAPAYKGEIIASNPAASGTAYTMVSGILQMKGEEAGWAYLEQLYANIPQLTKRGSGPNNLVPEGEYAIGLSPDPHVAVIRNKDKGLPIKAIYPSDGVVGWPSPVAIVEGAKHPNNARILVDWALSDRGQKVLMQASPRVPVSPSVEPLEGVPSPKELDYVDYDFLGWGQRREEIMEEWLARFGDKFS